MSNQEAVVKYKDVISHLATSDLRQVVIRSEKLAQLIAGSKAPVHYERKISNGKAVIYKCIKKALFSSVTSISSRFSSDTDISQFLHLDYEYQTHFQALSGQIKKYCGVKKYYELKFAVIDHFGTEVQTNGLTLLTFWVTSFDEFVRRGQRNASNREADFQRFYKLMVEYSSWKWASNNKRQHQFMCQFRTKLKEGLARFYESFDFQKSSDPLGELIKPWERAAYVAGHIDAFTGEQIRIYGAELFWKFRNLVFSSISSVVLRLSDLQNIHNTFQPYGKERFVQDFARIRSLKWNKDDTVVRLIHALVLNDMFPYFSPEQVETMGRGVHFLRLLRKNFQENIIDVKDFHVQVMKYLNSQFKNDYNFLVASPKIPDRNQSLKMAPHTLNDNNKIQVLLSVAGEYTHFVDNEESLQQHMLYPRIYTNEQTPISDASTMFDSHQIYAVVSLLRYYLPENTKFFQVYYLPSIFKRILYYGTKFPHLYTMENCLERQVLESLTALEPSLAHAINNLVRFSMESLKNVSLISVQKTSSSVILLPRKEFKSLCEVNRSLNEPFWPNRWFANSWPDLANKQLEAGQILHDAFAFHLFEIELPIIIANTSNTHLKLVSNMCTTSILYLYNEADSLTLTTIQEKLAVLPASKRSEILLNNLSRLTKMRLLLLKEGKDGQKVYTFNFNYKNTGQSTSTIRVI
ncbi:hypothetical protein SKDZ_02G3660 [Saccharomyces kudriavzevii ZP591]|nr:hypothetical protein SKDZ_02G3660 [Saccharomyces kudriavzevii ZP591]